MSLLFTILATVAGTTGSAFLNATSNQTANKLINHVGSAILQDRIKKLVKEIKEAKKAVSDDDKK